MSFFKYLRLRDFGYFLKGLAQNRRIIWQLVENDIKNQYLGSFLGITWSFIQPVVFVLVLWFVFSTGLRGARASAGAPFILYLITGIISWTFFSNCITTGITAIKKNSYLVTKMVFRVSMLPLVAVLSSLVIHICFLMVVIILVLAHGYAVDLYYLQLIFYILAGIILTLGISWMTSAAVLFFPDLNQIIRILMQIGFWFTPIIWPIHRVPEKYQLFVKANPVYYLVKGYRDALLYKEWFWEDPIYTLYFWVLTGGVFLLGSIWFRKLKPHFADVI